MAPSNGGERGGGRPQCLYRDPWPPKPSAITPFNTIAPSHGGERCCGGSWWLYQDSLLPTSRTITQFNTMETIHGGERCGGGSWWLQHNSWSSTPPTTTPFNTMDCCHGGERCGGGSSTPSTITPFNTTHQYLVVNVVVVGRGGFTGTRGRQRDPPSRRSTPSQQAINKYQYGGERCGGELSWLAKSCVS
jgi:hypothetical protein